MFAFGFAKKDRANLDPDEIAVFKKAAKLVLGFTDTQMDVEVASGNLTEIDCSGEDLQE